MSTHCWPDEVDHFYVSIVIQILNINNNERLKKQKVISIISRGQFLPAAACWVLGLLTVSSDGFDQVHLVLGWAVLQRRRHGAQRPEDTHGAETTDTLAAIQSVNTNNTLVGELKV